MERQDIVWQGAALVRTFVNDVRGGVPYAADQIEIMLRVLAAGGRPVRRFADLGCGSGVLARAVLSAYPQAESTLVDFSGPMLDEARSGLGGHVPEPRIVTADLAQPQWVTAVIDRAPFDAVVSGYAIHHLTHDRKRELYREILALLEPGGWFVNVEHVASRTARIEAMSDTLMVDTMFAFHQAHGGNKTREQVDHDFVHRPDKAANILALIETQCEWLRDGGFEEVDCYFKVFELAVFGGRRPQA